MRRWDVLRAAGVVLIGLSAACIGPPYVDNTVALVPHAAPVQSTGQPMDRPFGVEVGATNLGDLTAPKASSVLSPPGIAVAEHQLRAAFAIAPTPDLRLTVLHERALSKGSHDLSRTHLPLGEDSAAGYGVAFAYSVPTRSPRWRVGVATELVVWRCPYVTSTDNVIDEGTNLVGVAAFGVTPSYRVGAWTWFANGTIGKHPTVDENAAYADVKPGPVNVTAAAGMAYRLDDAEVALDVHDTLTNDPVRYGPAVGLTLRIFAGTRTLR